MLVVVALLGAAVAVTWDPLIDADATIARAAYDLSYGHDGLDGALLVVAAVGDPGVLRLVLAVAAVLLAWRRAWRSSLWIAAVAVVEAAASPLLKDLVGRSRPAWSSPITTVGGYSFPSGHAAGAGLFATVAIVVTLSALPPGRLRAVLCAVWVLVGVVVGLDRVFLGVHYASDVVAGWLLGSAIALLGWQLVLRRPGVPLRPGGEAAGGGVARFAVVANPVHVTNVADFRRSIVAAATRWGWEQPLWLETRADDPGVSMCRRALAEGVGLVLAAGGDGTVRVVCSQLAHTGVAVGIVPLGTGNLLARNLGLPLHPGDAVDVALSGSDRKVDLVRIGGDELPETCFTVMAGLGLDAAIMAGAPDQLKARMGWPAYVVSALRQLRHPATWVEVRVDEDTPMRRKVRTVVVGNVGLLQAGIPLLPDAVIDDGRLDVVVIAPARTVGWVRLVWRVLRRTRHTDERLDRMTGRQVRVRADKPLLRQLDGDPVGEGRELYAEVLPGALLVRVPQPAGSRRSGRVR